MDIQSSKLELMRLILGIENPKLINKIQEFVRIETADIWDDLTLSEKKELESAIRDLDNGKGLEWKEFKKSIA